jgi:tetratricopeptide (TPR) repeat protein
MPECADGCASLAMCLIGLGEVSAARPHLHRAAWLQPGNPNHSWNLAAVAHREGRLGACYLALVDYLEHAGEFDEAPGNSEERRRIAGAFTAEYERIARLEHPDAGPEAVAHADDLVHRAMLRVQIGQGPEAICVLEQALSFVPTHYQAMAYLGMAHAERHELEEASRYLDRALAVRPGYPLALEARERLLGPTSMPPKRAAPRRRSSPRKSRAGKKRGS